MHAAPRAACAPCAPCKPAPDGACTLCTVHSALHAPCVPHAGCPPCCMHPVPGAPCASRAACALCPPVQRAPCTPPPRDVPPRAVYSLGCSIDPLRLPDAAHGGPCPPPGLPVPGVQAGSPSLSRGACACSHGVAGPSPPPPSPRPVALGWGITRAAGSGCATGQAGCHLAGPWRWHRHWLQTAPCPGTPALRCGTGPDVSHLPRRGTAQSWPGALPASCLSPPPARPYLWRRHR